MMASLRDGEVAEGESTSTSLTEGGAMAVGETTGGEDKADEVLAITGKLVTFTVGRSSSSELSCS